MPNACGGVGDSLDFGANKNSSSPHLIKTGTRASIKNTRLIKPGPCTYTYDFIFFAPQVYLCACAHWRFLGRQGSTVHVKAEGAARPAPVIPMLPI